MKILVVGRNDHFAECRNKLVEHHLIYVASHKEALQRMSEADVVFDFLISEDPGVFPAYYGSEVTLFLNTWKISLRQLVGLAQGEQRCSIFGFNGFPTMFNREFLEVSTLHTEDTSLLHDICSKLRSKYLLVDDRVGLVTPRVVCMIINEAYFTVQELTATRQDIDLAMRIGTNYPYGPFEWCERIGLKFVYELLDALYLDTRDERYKIAPLMKKEYLQLR